MGHLALFDQRGALRGLFKTESVEMAALVRAAEFLLEKPDEGSELADADRYPHSGNSLMTFSMSVGAASFVTALRVISYL